MWDWDRAITMPLVLQALDREITRQRERRPAGEPEPGWPQLVVVGNDVLNHYFRWAPGVDRFAPVQIDSDYDVQVQDPARPESGLTGPGGQPVRFRGRIDMLAVDEFDAYWLVRHGVRTEGWPGSAGLTRDEEALADAWAWEQFYPGMVIAGTIYNEIAAGHPELASTALANTGAPGIDAAPPAARDRRRWRPGRRRGSDRPADPAGPGATRLVRQHEPSGGGRSVPQHRRLDARAREPVSAPAVEQVTTMVPASAGLGFRRRWVRHSPEAISAAGLRLASDTAAMLRVGPDAAPNPSDANCRPCAFLQPCLAMRAGRDSEFLLRSGYRARPPDALEEGRLGGSSWGTGRGAAPFRGGS